MRKKYFLEVFGCQMNKSDAERLSSILDTLGMERTENENDAQLIAVQACSVRQSAIDRIFARIHVWQERQKTNKELLTLLTGCVLPDDKKKFNSTFDILLDTHDLLKLPDILYTRKFLSQASAKAPKHISSDEVTNDDFFGIKPNYGSSFQAYIPIQAGCNNFCTFCAVPYTKGRERYRSHTDILHEIRQLIEKGYKEITLLGQNVNTYFDPTLKSGIGKRLQYRKWNALTDFPRLLRLVNDLQGDFWIRFITSNPWDMSDETIRAVAECEKICEYIHLPAQAGHDYTLKRMNRHHTVAHYQTLISKIRNKIKEPLSITTDIIVGFPGETREHFEGTATLLRDVGYDMAYIARYSPRPNTIAKEYFKDDVSREEKRERERILTEILKASAIERNRAYIGKTLRVLVEKQKREGVFLGKTRTFKSVIFHAHENCVGEFVELKITAADTWGLEGILHFE